MTDTNMVEDLRNIKTILKRVQYDATIAERDRCQAPLQSAWHILSKAQIAGFADSLGAYHRVSLDELNEVLECISAAIQEKGQSE